MTPEQFMNMPLKQFAEKRRNKAFTAEEIIRFLDKQNYRWRLIDTLIPCEGSTGYTEKVKEDGYTCICWPYKNPSYKSDLRGKMENEEIPRHFAYIKFYVDRTCEESANGVADHIYALVAGKTNQTRMDLEFATLEVLEKKSRDKEWDSDFEKKGDKAKRWLYKRKENFRWYYEKILVFWSPKAEGELTDSEIENLAYSVEMDIGGLFGLFTS
ncbi:MAG: hypothetical protein HFF07_05535 [Oscillospiraceae bacterium]|nr:hypothetical protein [Oscillospiraceae bacterium]